MLGRKVGSKECPQENSFEIAWWLIFGNLFGYPLGQKSRRGTLEAQGLEHKVQGPEHMSQICSRPCAPAPLDGSLGRLWGALVHFLVESVSKKGAKRMSERGQKGAEK